MNDNCAFQTFPGMVPYKRPAADKAGMPVYQPATTYQQLMQLQQPFVPVSCEYPAPATSAPPTAPAVPSLPPPPTSVSVSLSAPSPTAPAPQPSAAQPSPTPPPGDLERADAAAVAKEVAHKNYAAALALAAQQSAVHAAAMYKARAMAAPGLLRHPYMMRPSWPPAPMAMPAYYQQPYMYTMPPPNPPAAAAAAAAAASVVNPYKKMKTT